MEFISGNIFIRPMVFDQAGSTIEGHAHNFDHTTYVVRGSVRIEALDDAGNLITNSLVIADASNGCTGVSVTTGGSAVNCTEQTVANENTAPSGVTFSQPSNLAGGLSIGDVPAGQHKAIWVRRTVNAAAAVASDSFALRVQCDTNP